VILEDDHHQHLALRCIITLNRELPKHCDSITFILDDKREARNMLTLMDGEIPEHLWYVLWME
jgi:hypothetical protein